MDILQTYETTITSDSGVYSLSVLVIPARSYGPLAVDGFSLHEVGGYLFGEPVEEAGPTHYIEMKRFTDVIRGHYGGLYFPDAPNEAELDLFANYALNARFIPFEQSPLSPESLAGLAASSVKAGTITLGATVGFMVGGHSPFLLVTVPAGIILCGASVSFAKWLEENRKSIWERLLSPSMGERARSEQRPAKNPAKRLKRSRES